MTDISSVGIGELLRHLSDLFDRDAERVYAEMETGLDYRARYTPVLRGFGDGPLSITELQQKLRVTQGAVSQTVKLMEADGLLQRVASEDHRMRRVALTEKGAALRDRLTEEWELHLRVIAGLEAEIGTPLRRHLALAIGALERESYYSRIAAQRRDPRLIGRPAGLGGAGRLR